MQFLATARSVIWSDWHELYSCAARYFAACLMPSQPLVPTTASGQPRSMEVSGQVLLPLLLHCRELLEELMAMRICPSVHPVAAEQSDPHLGRGVLQPVSA